jgi:hypothetical protein
VLTKILGPKKGAEITVWWRKLRYEELKDPYVWVINSRMIQWAGNMA